MSVHEQPLVIPSGDLELEAVLAVPDPWLARALVVICHPHPLYGGSMDNNVVLALADAALQEGIAALRFNFRGTGRSSGVHGGGGPETDDVVAAAQTAMRLHPDAVLSLAGYSFGAARAAEACQRLDAAPHCLVLVSPPLRSGSVRLPAQAPPLLLISGDQDPVCPVESVTALASERTPPPDLITIDGADHSWWGYEDQLRDSVAGFLRWYAAPGPRR